MAMKFIHLTDPHLVNPGARLNGLNPEQRLRAGLENIFLFHSDAELCVITGDLSDNGSVESYRLLSRILADYRLPYQLLLGNHDNREHFCEQFPEFEVDQSGFVQYSHRTTAGVFLFLDTLLSGSDAGSYCQKRRNWLLEVLACHRQEPVFLFMHHPPLTNIYAQS